MNPAAFFATPERLPNHAIGANRAHSPRGEGQARRGDRAALRPVQVAAERQVEAERLDDLVLASGKTYVNVHAAKNPAGEIRGQVH